MPTRPLIIAHRGASAVAPENTMAAFRAAIDVGADGIEFDVRLSKDRIPVIIHDDNLKRTGSLNKPVATLSAAELQRVDVGSWFARSRGIRDDQFNGEHVPTLQELFDLYQRHEGKLYLEMKCGSQELRELADLCCAMTRNNSLADLVVIECFDLKGIELVKRVDPSIRTAALFEPTLRTPLASVSQNLVAKALDAGADEIALNHRLVNRRLVESAKDAGLNVVVWTVDDPRWFERPEISHIDAVITNDPALMLNASATPAD